VIADKVKLLFDSQLRDWELAARNYNQLGKILTRSVSFEGFSVIIQFNPERIRSSSAKVDARSIGERVCFLCKQNRPKEQTGVSIAGDMTILVNPYPIFRRHLTIISEHHEDQRIRENFYKMLELARLLPGYVIFYNGPQCGASAPDHLHFQAGNRGFMPVEADFYSESFAQKVISANSTRIWKWNGYLRTIISFEGDDPDSLTSSLEKFLDNFSNLQPGLPESMLNILTYFNDGGWVIHVFPRKVHRPVQYFAEGEKQILLSPAAVDLGGVLITPREEDFRKITASDIKDIFRQACLDENEVPALLKGL